MPKTINTPREELICGKLDVAQEIARNFGAIELVYILDDIRHDAERMEAMLAYRKKQVQEYCIK